ncbi:hypothetical protein VTK56DRAFT_732 [Thermocarpiscus australiensis]
MPSSDNLYSMMEDELGADENHGLRTVQQSQLGNDSLQDGHADQETSGSVDGPDVEDPLLLSPTDGYFGTASGTSTGTRLGASSLVPNVPDILVEDPSLQRNTAESKAREAEQERLERRHDYSNWADGYTAAYPSHAMPAYGNGSTSAQVLPFTQQSVRLVSQSTGATYDSSLSSYRIPPTTTPTSYTPYTARSTVYDGEGSFFLPSEAPPAYTPSPTSPPSIGIGNASINYRTFSPVARMGRREEAQGLLVRQPESMRDSNPTVLDDAAPGWSGRMRRLVHRANPGRCKVVTLLIGLVLLLMTVGFLSSLVSEMRGEGGRSQPQTPQNPDQPAMDYPTWKAGHCRGDRIARPTETFDLSFSADRQFTFVEKIDHDDGYRDGSEVHVQGAVIFRRAASDTPSSSVTVEIVVDDDRLHIGTSWDGEEQVLKVIVPLRVDWSRRGSGPCANIKATVWVPEDSKLENLKVNTVHLDIRLLDNLSLSVSKQTKLSSVVGPIIAASTGADARDDKIIDVGAPDSFRFHSRLIEVKTTSAPIRGSWPLYDYLGLQSTSGDIKVCIEPKEADKDSPKPAILYIKSLSGDVEFREPIHAAEQAFRTAQTILLEGGTYEADIAAETLLPPRDYRVDVYTTSGDITGASAFSSGAGFKSTSGTISLDLLPVLDSSLAKSNARDVRLQTTSTSGTTDVTVLEPLWIESADAARGAAGGGGYVPLKPSSASASEAEAPESGPLLRCLYSEHSSTSANIRLRYPGSWEGDISLSSLTGPLQVGGEGVKIIRSGSEWPGIKKHILARKGEVAKGGEILGKSTSGSVEVLVGEKK